MTPGVCITHRDGDYIEVDKADPLIFVGAFTVATAESGIVPAINVTEGMLEIHGRTQIVRYRLGDYLPDKKCYVATLEL